MIKVDNVYNAMNLEPTVHTAVSVALKLKTRYVPAGHNCNVALTPVPEVGAVVEDTYKVADVVAKVKLAK